MDIKTHVEDDWVAELIASAPAELNGLAYHTSLDTSQNQLPSVVVTADARPLIQRNHTYELTVQVILSTQSDDTADSVAKVMARSLTEYLASDAFRTALEIRASVWLPVHLELSSTDSTDTEDRRFIQRSQFRLIAQG